MWQKLQRDWQVLKEGISGQRFQHFAWLRKQQRREGTAKRSARWRNLIIGTVMIVFGLAIGWLPGPGGFVAILGLAVLAQELPFVARVLDRIEMMMCQHWRTYCRLNPMHKTLLVGLILFATGGILLVFWQEFIT